MFQNILRYNIETILYVKAVSENSDSIEGVSIYNSQSELYIYYAMKIEN